MEELEQASEPSEDFDVEFKIRLPRQVARRLMVAAEARRVDAGPLASAVVAKALGAEVKVPAAKPKRKARFADPEVQAEMRLLHEAGMTPSEIAANLDAKRSTVVVWMTQLGLPVMVQKPGRQRESTVMAREVSERFKRLAAQRDDLEAAS